MNRQALCERFRHTRQTSRDLCRPLKAEDFRIQSMPDVSPPWWNLGHTTWFFAKNVLERCGRYRPSDARLEYVLNSYYESLGPRIPRGERGLVTRPTTEEIYDFRTTVDERMESLFAEASDEDFADLAPLVEVGIHHEQQHQELLVTELKHIFGTNPSPLREPYCSPAAASANDNSQGEATFVPFSGGVHEVGNLEGGWCWDNEAPVHKAYLEDFALLNRLVTNREYLAFVEDGGYRDPLLWLSNGWATVKEEGWESPLYWERGEDGWQSWTLAGNRPLDLDEPVCHVSFYEADAYATWRARQEPGIRLPTEREWEHGARQAGFTAKDANLLESGAFHPRAVSAANGSLAQTAGDLWEWTSSHYEPYPGYQPFGGSLMEYNGKFMDNQRVLRGGSCATPASHIRVSYRNFWPANTRFQFTGIRLARSV